MPDIHSVYCVNYTEYERDQGSRADGHSLHASFAHAQKHCQESVAGRGDDAPAIYSLPGRPYLVEVDAATYAQVMAAGMIQGDARRHFGRP